MKPRKTPCASCPYRRDAPSGIWAPSEYNKLAQYDGGTGEQAEAGAFAVFRCHQGNNAICAGWAAVAGDEDCLALRLARSLHPEVDIDAVLDYTTSVPLFRSGAEAAAHGMREIEAPGARAQDAMDKIHVIRAARGEPLIED